VLHVSDTVIHHRHHHHLVVVVAAAAIAVVYIVVYCQILLLLMLSWRVFLKRVFVCFMLRRCAFWQILLMARQPRTTSWVMMTS